MTNGADTNCKVIAGKKIGYAIGAIIDDVPRYLRRFGNKYIFVNDIGNSIMTLTRTDAIQLLAAYREATGDMIDCVILPIEITYEILDR